jgi:hypothetical protein
MSKMGQTSGVPLTTSGKRVVSLLIAFHFGAILVAVTEADNLWLPAQLRIVRFAALFRPYLQLVFMNNPYRFFAPNPTATVRLYFHVTRHDGTTKWVELPRRAEFGLPLIYHRFCKMPQHAVRKMRYPMDRSQWALNRLGQACIASYVRQIAREDGGSPKDGRPGPGARVEVYQVSHGLMSLAQARRGWEPTDLRLFEFHFLGDYMSDGRRIDDGPIRKVRKESLLSEVYYHEVIPRMSRNQGTDLTARQVAAAEEIGVPEPIRASLGRSPQFLDAVPDELATRFGTGRTKREDDESPFGMENQETTQSAGVFPL